MQENNVASNSGSVETVAAVVFYSHTLGVTFDNENPISQNKIVQEVIAQVPPEYVTVDNEDGTTTFPVNTNQFAHLMHLMYCDAPEGFNLRTDFDGIYQYEGKDEDGNTQLFNSQLITLSLVAA